MLWPFLVVLCLLNFSGTNLSEVARLWTFLVPFATLGAARCVVWFRPRAAWQAAFLVLQFSQALVFAVTLDVLLRKATRFV